MERHWSFLKKMVASAARVGNILKSGCSQRLWVRSKVTGAYVKGLLLN
jgi:hypothetical protein